VTLVEAETEFDDDGFTIVKAPSVEKEADKSPMVMTADEIVHEQELAAIDEIAKQPYNHLRSQYFTGVRKAIALFAFQLEANVKSRCKKLPQSHVVELNDYEILEITPDIKAEYGYHFEVKKCISPAFPL
jgi:hypothetical protein